MTTPLSDSYLQEKFIGGFFILRMYNQIIKALQEIRQDVDDLEGDEDFKLVQQSDKDYWYFPSAEAEICRPLAKSIMEATNSMDESFRLHFDPPSPTWLYLVTEKDFETPGNGDNETEDTEEAKNNPGTTVNDPNSQTESLRQWQLSHDHKMVFYLAGQYVESVEETLKELFGFFSKPVTLGGQDKYIDYAKCLQELEYALNQLMDIRDDIYGDFDLPENNHNEDGPWNAMNKQDMEYAIRLYRRDNP